MSCVLTLFQLGCISDTGLMLFYYKINIFNRKTRFLVAQIRIL